MKKLIILLFVAAGFTSCENYTAQIDKLKQEKDSVAAVSAQKDQQISEFVSAVSDIENNISTITQKQGSISEDLSKNPEKMKDARQRINDQIAEINTLMDQSKTQIAALNKKLKNSRGEVGKLQKLIAGLQEQLTSKETELADLNTKIQSMTSEIATLNTNVSTLTTEKEQQTAVITDQTTKLHTAYVAVGTYKQLRDKNVVEKEGGVLGLGAEKVLKHDANNEAFEKIDITAKQTFEIHSRDAEVITAHPQDSYKLVKAPNNDKEVAYLEITDPEKFWKASKYLVVLKD